MHIEPGWIEALRVPGSNIAAVGLGAVLLPRLAAKPVRLLSTVLAALLFTLLMQSWHVPVGPSELHLIGATTLYLLLGSDATVAGFAPGLALQAVLFEPSDAVHIGVNFLTLAVPLIAMHVSCGRRLFDSETASGVRQRFSLARVLRLDAVFYSGVFSMVSFWLLLARGQTPLDEWLLWAGRARPRKLPHGASLAPSGLTGGGAGAPAALPRSR